MLYQINNGTISLGGEVILRPINFSVKGKEKIALVGKNGSGKTTLLKLIAGELSLDRDDKSYQPGILIARNTTIGMLGQIALSDKTRTVEEEILSLCHTIDPFSRERYDFEQEYDRLFTGFGFSKEDKKKKLDQFSGGEQTKIGFIKLLLEKPDILLLDEPTNHLDMDCVRWLEEYIRSYERAVIMVSHDRYFLDQTAEYVYEISDRTLFKYAGNYSQYRKQKRKNNALDQKKYIAQQKEVERLNALIERFKHKPKKAAMARSKRKQLGRMQLLKNKVEKERYIFTKDIEPLQLGSKNVLDADKLVIGYNTPLKEITLRIRRGQKIGIIGANGTGKTTFLKTVCGMLPAISGKYYVGNGVEVTYFDQNTAEIQSEKRVFEYFHDAFPQWNIKDVKKTLGHYLFYGEDTRKKLSDLSGGEKSRLMLGEILERKSNFLLLDEPTNHMDIPAKETLESAFQAFKGTMLFISHDRYFLSEVATALLIFEEDGVKYYPFGYQHYMERLQKREQFKDGILSAVEAENTVLRSELKAVPNARRIQAASFNTEQSFADWQLSMSLAHMEKEKQQLEVLLETFNEEQYWMDEEYKKGWNEKYSSQLQLFHERILHWYDQWILYEEAFKSYRD